MSTTMASKTTEQFNAAVQLIRGMPKSGPFQPSNDMKLRLYSYFKQATEGPCEQPAPGFWDVVGKAKWSSWKDLGDMSAQRAMTAYVDEIKQVIETMSLTEDVTVLMDAIGPLYEFTDDDPSNNSYAESTSPPPPAVIQAALKQRKRVRFSSAESESAHTDQSGGNRDGAEAVVVNGHRPLENGHLVNGHSTAVAERGDGRRATSMVITSDTEDDEEFNDTMEDPSQLSGTFQDPETRIQQLQRRVDDMAAVIDNADLLHVNATGEHSPPSGDWRGQRNAGSGHGHRSPALHQSTTVDRTVCLNHCREGVRDELLTLMRDMKRDVDVMNTRLRSLEVMVQAATPAPPSRMPGSQRPWWQFPKLSPVQVALLLIGWPTLIHFTVQLIRGRRPRR